MIAQTLLLVFVATATAQKDADLSVDCGSDWVTVRWRPGLDFSQKVDPSRALLGNCPPSRLLSEDVLFFRVFLRDCGFLQQVTPGRVTFSNMLIYDRQPELPFLSQSVQCVYDLPADERSGTEEPDGTGGQETFSMEIMTPDFSGPAPSLTFRLGSSVPVRATVETRSRGPLRIYLDSCEFSTDADISRAAQVYPVIANAGCLMGSRAGNSSFLPRRRPDEMRLYLEAVRFALGEKIFLHCELEARAVRSQTGNGKACQFVPEQRRWVLLDDPSQSSLCSCCDSSCVSQTDGVSERKVLGPFVIVESDVRRDAALDSRAAGGVRQAPVWQLVVGMAAALLLVMSVVSVSYYLCFWRGGRLGYRPGRDLLSRY